MTNQNRIAKRIRVLLVDDHVVMREGTRLILEEQGDIVVVAETDDGAEAVELARQTSPDVVLMDIKIKGLNGIEATKAIKRQCAGTQVVALTGYDFDQYVRAMIGVGAAGFLLKSASGEEVVSAVRAAKAGNMVFGAHVARRVADTVAGGGGQPPYQTTDQPALSERELEILFHLSEGRRNAHIADTLGIQLKTVEYHLRNLYEKLGVASRTAAIIRARHLGLVPDDSPSFSALPDDGDY